MRFRVQGCIAWFLSQAHASQLWVRKVNLEEQRFRKSNDCLDARGACFSRAQEQTVAGRARMPYNKPGSPTTAESS